MDKGSFISYNISLRAESGENKNARCDAIETQRSGAARSGGTDVTAIVIEMRWRYAVNAKYL